MFQTKEQNKSPEKDLYEMKISSPPDKEFREMVIKMLTKVGRRMDEHCGNFNKETENIKKCQTEVVTTPKTKYTRGVQQQTG